MDQYLSGPHHTPSATRTSSGSALLLQLVTEDAEAVFTVHSDPRVYVLDPSEVHHSLEDSRAFIAPMVEHWVTFGFGYWSVWVDRGLWGSRSRQPFLGPGQMAFAGLAGAQRHIVAQTECLNVYFRLAPEVQGRGLAGEIVDEVIELGRRVAPGVDLVIRTRPANAAARRVAHRAGFVDEGLEPGQPDMQLLRLAAQVAAGDAGKSDARPVR